jgi:hypothetical protein
MATAAETIGRVRLAIEDPEEKFFTLEDYVRVYNDALDEISEITEVYEKSVYVKRRKHALYADLRGVLPPTFLRITSVYNPHSGKWLNPTSVRELDASIGRFWERRAEHSRWWFMRGLWFLGSYPVAEDDVHPLKIWYSALMPHVEISGGKVSGTENSPDLPPDFHTAIENYMMYALLAERKEADKALAYYQRFTGQILPGLKDMAENRMRRDRPAKMGARRM